MYPRSEDFIVSHSEMDRYFASYDFGTNVIHKTKGIWVNPISAAFFRIIQYRIPQIAHSEPKSSMIIEHKNHYMIEVVTELPLSKSFANRPSINLNILTREESKPDAFYLCQQYFDNLLNHQQNNISKQESQKNGWLGKFVYNTPPIEIPIAYKFGTELSWGITKVSANQYNVYLLAFDNRENKYGWIEFISFHKNKSLAMKAANEAYQDTLDAQQYDQVISNLL